MSSYTQKGHTMLLQSMLTYIPKLFNQTYKNPYGSELERYIVSHNPQSIYDVEKLTQEFDKKNSEGMLK